MVKAVFLDLDDTIIAIQPLFERAEALLTEYLGRFGVTPKEAHDALMAKDKEVYTLHGFARHSMPLAYEFTLKHFVPAADADMINEVRSFADTIFTTTPDIKPGVVDALQLFSDNNVPVYILTQGDQSIQNMRLEKLPFLDKFANIFIVDRKNKDVYADTVAKIGLNPEDVVMMGDSLRSDVIPSVAAGLHGVLIEAENSQLHEAAWHGAADLPAERAYRFSSLFLAAEHLVNNGHLHAARQPAAPKDQGPSN